MPGGKANEYLGKTILNPYIKRAEAINKKENFVFNMIDMALLDFKVKQADSKHYIL